MGNQKNNNSKTRIFTEVRCEEWQTKKTCYMSEKNILSLWNNPSIAYVLCSKKNRTLLLLMCSGNWRLLSFLSILHSKISMEHEHLASIATGCMTMSIYCNLFFPDTLILCSALPCLMYVFVGWLSCVGLFQCLMIHACSLRCFPSLHIKKQAPMSTSIGIPLKVLRVRQYREHVPVITFDMYLPFHGCFFLGAEHKSIYT